VPRKRGQDTASMPAAVGAERPEVALAVAGGERARRHPGTKRRLVRSPDDLGVRRDGSLEDGIDVVGDDVTGARPRPHLTVNAVDVFGRAEHDRPAFGPTHLGVDHIAVAVPDSGRRAETERIDQQSQRGGRVVVVQHRLDRRLRHS
jgi:hypothetical protein